MYNHQLDTFLQVARLGSFSRAAEALYISPTAVIKQMNLLEERLGVALFNRSHRGLTLTGAGDSLARDAPRIIALCREAVEHAQGAARSESALIRVGTSIMTPATVLTGAWPRIHDIAPELSLKLVSFENTPENASHILGHLGEDIDVVCGVYDEQMLALRRCAARKLVDEPICLAVSATDPLAQVDMIHPEDLAGRQLMLMQRGWSKVTDRMRDELPRMLPYTEFSDFSFYNVEAFNVAELAGALILTFERWKDVHPLMTVKPVAWDYSMPYGILHAPVPSPTVRFLLDCMGSIDA